MAIRKTRSPRQKYDFVCPQCHRDFIGFRKNAVYCGDLCRSAFHAASTPMGRVRQFVYDRDGHKCTECGSDRGLIVRSSDPDHRTASNSRVLCGMCNAKESQRRFHANHPELPAGVSTRRYSSRVYTERREAEVESR